MSKKATAASTPTERQAKYRTSGRQITVVVTEEKALAKLDLLVDKFNGSVKASVEHALRGAKV